MNPFVIISVIYLILSLYGYQAYKTLFKNPWMHTFYQAGFIGSLAFVLVMHLAFGNEKSLVWLKSTANGVFLSFFVFALVLSVFMLVEDVFRVITFLMNKLTGLEGENPRYMPSRRKFLSGLAVLIGALPFGALLYGMYKGKYNYRVLKYDLEFDDLPDAFEGYQITQISDVHSGSFDNYDQVAYGVNLVNEQESDLILFTGDLVNDRTDEMLPWSYLFSTLKANDGVFSVLGNHDYGDYMEWENDEAKAKNMEDMFKLQSDMGFQLLKNEHRIIEKEGAQIALVGVENWGTGRFKKKGDLDKAIEGLDEAAFTILMSHDPSHWDEKVLKHPKKCHLTLSGHTHGMQFGVEIPGVVRFSPVQFRYKQWAGIYKEQDQYLNVNRGFGFIGYPGRVGIWPEISVITLKKTKKA